MLVKATDYSLSTICGSHSREYVQYYRLGCVTRCKLVEVLILIWCILLRLLSIRKTNHLCSQLYLLYIHTTTCFGLHRSSSGIAYSGFSWHFVYAIPEDGLCRRKHVVVWIYNKYSCEQRWFVFLIVEVYWLSELLGLPIDPKAGSSTPLRKSVNFYPIIRVTYPSRKRISVVWVRERTISNERLSLVGEVSAYFCG
jgi:hypothetical protein